jgi:hypothetical protein
LITNEEAELRMLPTRASSHKGAISLKVSEPEKIQLERLLRDRLLNDAVKAAIIGFRPRIFRVMLAELGSVQTCIRLITSNTVPVGFSVLWEKGRLDLTAEAAVLSGPWKALFDASVLKCAEERLRNCGRPDLIPK